MNKIKLIIFLIIVLIFLSFEDGCNLKKEINPVYNMYFTDNVEVEKVVKIDLEDFERPYDEIVLIKNNYYIIYKYIIKTIKINDDESKKRGYVNKNV